MFIQTPNGLWLYVKDELCYKYTVSWEIRDVLIRINNMWKIAFSDIHLKRLKVFWKFKQIEWGVYKIEKGRIIRFVNWDYYVNWRQAKVKY